MTAHPMDSRIYGHLWSTPETNAIFSDEGRTQCWLEILAALAEAQAAVGLVPQAAALAIRSHADVALLDLDEVGVQTRATGHSTLGLIRCLQEVLPPEAREWVYYGATVQDVTDTWTALVMARVAGHLVRDLDRLQQTVDRLAREHAATVMLGRTHGQPGLPITFGFKAAVWASEVRRHRQRLAEGRTRWSVAQLGGALGTMEFWGDESIPLLEEFAARLGLQAPDIAWLTARDRIAEFVGMLALITATIGKIGQEIFQLQRFELSEVREARAEGTVGSITMPHKVNPESSEHLVTLARIVRSHASLALEAMLPEHERDGRAWKAEWLFLPESCSLAAASLAIAVPMLEGLKVDAERMAANLEATRGYVMSEPVMRRLAGVYGKHRAHSLVYEAAMRGLDSGTDFGHALAGTPAIAEALTPEQLRAALDPRQALGRIEDFVARAVPDALADPHD